VLTKLHVFSLFSIPIVGKRSIGYARWTVSRKCLVTHSVE
jgi:hypothetical protein